jgi:putative hemolysin
VVFLFILLLVLLAATAFFSGSETALFSLTRYEVSQFRNDKQASHRLVAHLLEHPRKLLLTLMIGNVTLNMFIFATSLALFQRLPGRIAFLAPILGLISPVLLTLMGDIMPKGLAILLGKQMAVRAAPVIRLVQIALTPFSLILTGLVEPLTRLLAGGKKPSEYVTVGELQQLIEMSERRRIIDADENAMLSEAVLLGKIKVREIMVHRVDMIAFEIHDDPDELRKILRENGFAKVPVYDEQIDHIIGLIYAKDFFLNPNRPLQQLVRPVKFVPELVTLTQLLNHFRRTRSQLSIVVDEYGGVVGLATVEDVARQIVGELAPEDEDEKQQWEKLDDRHYRVSGSVSIRDWADEFSVAQWDERVTTLGGLIVTRLGRPAETGDRVLIGNLLMIVESLRGRRIEWVLLELMNGQVRRDNGKTESEAQT